MAVVVGVTVIMHVIVAMPVQGQCALTAEAKESAIFWRF